MIKEKPHIRMIRIINSALLSARGDVAEAQIQYDQGPPDIHRTFIFDNIKAYCEEIKQCLKWAENMTVWAAEHTSDIHSGGYDVLSLHYSKREAEKTMHKHRSKEYKEWKECWKKPHESNLNPFGQFEDWRLKERKIEK